MFSILKSERGAVVILGAITLLIVIGVFGTALVRETEAIYKDLNRARARIVAAQTLQDFAVMAQKANDTYNQNSGACPSSGTFTWPNTTGFCWPGSAATACIVAPQAGKSTQAQPVQWCFGGGSTTDKRLNATTLTLNMKVRPTHEQTMVAFKQVLKEHARGWADAIFNSGVSYAAGPYAPWVPDITAAPSVRMADKCLAGGTNDLRACVTCAAAPGYTVNTDACITLHICPLASGTCNANQEFIEKVALIKRTPPP